MEAILREKEREDKLQSAKKKLKSYRARQSKSSLNGPISPNDGAGPSSSSSKRLSHASSMSHKSKASITGPPASPVRAAARQHAHRRSLSVSGNTAVLAAAAAGQSQQTPSHARRNSTRRHSRNISMSINSTPSFQADSPLATSISAPSSATISGASPSLATTRFNTLSASASSPSLSSHSLFATQQQQQQQQHASSSSLSTFGTLSTNRQSVPHFTTAPNGRILSPSSSPMVPQHSASAAPSPQNYSPFRRASLQMKPISPSPSALAENTFPTPPPAPSHARRPSKHTRRTSVATRRESMEIMAGTLNFLPPSSPEPNNYSATGAFLAASADMSRSSTWASSSSSSDSSTVRQQQSQQSSPFEADIVLSEEDQRKAALRALEGTLTEKSDAIELPTEFSLPAVAGIVSPTSLKMEKRASWNGAPLTNAGGKGATDLGMLVEEEEEDESESQDIVASLGPSSTMLNKAPAASANKRQRPSSLIFPPSRSLPFASARPFQIQPSPSAEPVSPTTKEPPTNIQKTGPRPLSLSSSVSSPSLHSSTTPSFITSEKSARRLSGLKSLTLASPEHALSGSSTSAAATSSPASSVAARRRLSGATGASTSSPASSTRPFSIASSSSIPKERDGHVSPDGMRSFQLGAGSSTRTKKSSPSLSSIALSSSTNSTMSGTPARSRASLSYRTTPSPIATSAASTSFSGMTSPNTTYNNSRRYSELSFASSAGPFGFGDLVMEESILQEEDEDEEDCPRDVDSEEKDEIEKTERLDLLHVERPPLSRSSSSNSSVAEDPVILSMQVQALRSQIEHLRIESSTLQSQVSSAEQARASESETLRNEITQLNDANEELEMEREMLREDIDGWRTRCNDLERTLQLERSRAEDERKEGILLREKVRKLGDRLTAAQSCSPGESSGEDQALASAQAKLISEMRDQIFTLAAALERERLKNMNSNEGSQTTSPLLKALASYQSKDADVQPISGRHNESATGSNASSFNFSMSSGSGSIRSGFGNTTEDTSAGDDDSVFGLGSKSPVSPASASTCFPSSGISMHPMSMPLRHVDSNVALGGLHTLTEEEEEEEYEEEEILEETMSEMEEEEDKIPELVPDEFRTRTQSASTGSTDTNDHMPLTPAKESPNMPQQKDMHDRSDSFLKQWSFPKGTVARSSFDESCERFWSIRHDSLPPLPVAANVFETPFSAEISLDEDYFTSALTKKASSDNTPLTINPSAQGPPPNRSSIQAQRMSAEVESVPPSATSSVGSRLSWMWSGYLKPSPVPSAPASQLAALDGASPYPSISSVASSAVPPLPPKSAPLRPAVISSRKLLKLQPSPSSRLDFTHSCACDGSQARIIRL